MSKYIRPNNTTQTATAYVGNIDNAFAVFELGSGPVFQAHAQATPDMTVRVEKGYLWNGPGSKVTSVAAQSSGTITAPVSNPRIDAIVIDVTAGAVAVVGGSEAASPSAPAIASNQIPLAFVTLGTGTSAITNSNLADARPTHFGDVGSGSSGLSSVAADTTPQLGGNLDVSGNEILSTSNSNLALHSDNDLNITLGDAAGSNKISVKDSASNEVASVNSDGDAVFVTVTANTIGLASGTSINEFSTDGTLAGNSDNAAPTEKAVKTYVDANAGGPVVVLNSQTASSSSQISFGSSHITSTYNHYRVEVKMAKPATDGVQFEMQFSTNNGSTWVTAAYAWVAEGRWASSNQVDSDSSDSLIQITPTTWDNGTYSHGFWTVDIYSPASSSLPTCAKWHGGFTENGSGGEMVARGSGKLKSTSAMNAIRFKMSSGNIASGTFTLYGLKDS